LGSNTFNIKFIDTSANERFDDNSIQLLKNATGVVFFVELKFLNGTNKDDLKLRIKRIFQDLIDKGVQGFFFIGIGDDVLTENTNCFNEIKNYLNREVVKLDGHGRLSQKLEATNTLFLRIIRRTLEKCSALKTQPSTDSGFYSLATPLPAPPPQKNPILGCALL
jgi:hypothetical protein